MAGCIRGRDRHQKKKTERTLIGSLDPSYPSTPVCPAPVILLTLIGGGAGVLAPAVGLKLSLEEVIRPSNPPPGVLGLAIEDGTARVLPRFVGGVEVLPLLRAEDGRAFHDGFVAVVFEVAVEARVKVDLIPAAELARTGGLTGLISGA